MMVERPNVLVVDDDPEFLVYAREGLVGSTVVVARTPLQAIWLLERVPVRAVICDLVLGTIDGRHLLGIVRERWPTTARILVTGYGARLHEAKTFLAAQALLYKPCDLTALDRLLAALPTIPIVANAR